MPADGLTKGSVPRDALRLLCEKGTWGVTGRSEFCVGKRLWGTSATGAGEVAKSKTGLRNFFHERAREEAAARDDRG